MYTTAHPRVLKALRQAGFNCQQRQDILDTANQNGAEKFSHQQALSWAGVTEATLIEQCASLHELLDELETQVKNGESPDFNAALEPTVVSFEGMETAQRWLQPLQIHPVDLKAMDHVFGMLRNRYPQLLRSDLPGAANISPEAINLGRWWVVPFAVLFSLMLYAGASIVAGHFLSGWVSLVGAGLVLMVSLTAAFNVAGAKPLSQTYLSGIHGVSMALLGATLLVPAVVYKGFVLPSTSAQYQKQVLPVAVDASSPWLMKTRVFKYLVAEGASPENLQTVAPDFVQNTLDAGPVQQFFTNLALDQAFSGVKFVELVQIPDGGAWLNMLALLLPFGATFGLFGLGAVLLGFFLHVEPSMRGGTSLSQVATVGVILLCLAIGDFIWATF